MTQKDYIEHWVNSAEEDWRVVHVLAENKHYVQALFFAHLVIEKLLKAAWIKDNDNAFPPRVHNLEYLASQTTLLFQDEQLKMLRFMTVWNLEGRYQDYRNNFYRTVTVEYVAESLQKADEIRTWLLEQLL